jgi:hypothetical protein
MFTLGIVSASRADAGMDSNRVAHAHLLDLLEEAGLVHRAVLGMYKGTPEESVVVVLPDAGSVMQLLDLGRRFGQESVLLLVPGVGMGQGGAGHARLVYLDGRPTERLGEWRAVSDAEARRADAYTYDPYTDTYWVAGGAPADAPAAVGGVA